MENQENKPHPFTRTLGEGPYRFLGMFDLGSAIASLHAGNVHGYNNAMASAPRLVAGMGTCAHCGMAILNICIVKTGNGELYGVGSDCILKAGLPYKELTALEKAKKAHERKLRANRKAKKGDAARAELQALIDSKGDALKALPHVNAYRASQGDSLLDYAAWTLQHSNDGGIVFALARVKHYLEQGSK